MRAFQAVLLNELRLSLRTGSDVLTLVLFFVMVGVIAPFAIGPDRAVLARLAPGLIWLAAFLASLLGLDRLFRADHEDGTLMLLGHAAIPLAGVVAAKLLAHWMLCGLPLLLASPLLAVLLALDMEGFGRTLLALLAGTPALSALGAIGAAVTVSLRGGGMIAAVLVTPLAVPVLIFGVGSIASPARSGAEGAALLLLFAFSLLACALSPFAAALALRTGEP